MFQTALSYASLVSAILAVVLAVARNVPILHLLAQKSSENANRQHALACDVDPVHAGARAPAMQQPPPRRFVVGSLVGPSAEAVAAAGEFVQQAPVTPPQTKRPV
jgi:hypothetical protein